MPVIMKLVLGLSGIAPTRTIVGLLAQGLAGGAGGISVLPSERTSRGMLNPNVGSRNAHEKNS
jgi:hypothetical protein